MSKTITSAVFILALGVSACGQRTAEPELVEVAPVEIVAEAPSQKY